MASKGGTRTSSSSFRAAIRVQAPSRRAKASRVRATGSTNQRWPTPARGVDAALVGQVDPPGARAQDLADPVGREVEPGAIGTGRHPLAAPAGEVGDEDVGAEVQLGLVEDPPAAGAARGRCRRGRQISDAERSSWRGRGARQAAAAGAARPRSARRPCAPGRRGRPGRWPGGGPWGRAGSWRECSASTGACQAVFRLRCSGSRSTIWAISLVQAETQGMRERSTR